MDKLRAQKYFLEVADTQSFTAAAKRIGVPASSVSRRIQDLEKNLGAVLIHRSTRVVKLTELGEVYLSHIQPAINALDYADEVVGKQSQTPTGILRITALPGYGQVRLAPALAKFRENYPDIILDLEFTDRVSNLANDNVDIAFRATAELPGRVVARKVSENNFVLVASPNYLAQYGLPTTAIELQQHKTLLYRNPNGVMHWQVKSSEGWNELSTSPVFISNQGQALLNEVLQGTGIALIPEWGVENEVRNKQLQVISLVDAKVSISRNEDAGIFLIYHKPKYSVQKIRAAVDFLISELDEIG